MHWIVQIGWILLRSDAVTWYMEKDRVEQPPELGEVIDIVKRLIEQADKKINEAAQKIKTAESIISTAS